MPVHIARFEMAAPDDVGDLRRLLRDEGLAAARRLAIIGKTEGPATINDFSRALALGAIESCLGQSGLAATDQVQIILSTGCEGVIAPGGYVLADLPSGPGGIPGLAFGAARSEPLEPAQMLTLDHIRIVAAVVQRALADAAIDAEQVALVLLKTPLLTRDMAVGLSPLQRERANSSGIARGIGALGIALALGELNAADLTETTVGRSHVLHGRRGMVFSGTETRRCEAIVLANATRNRPAIRSGLVADLLDIDGLARILAPDAGDPIAAARALAQTGRVRGAFFKAGVAPDGRVRGHRTTVFSSELDPDKHMRAVASGVLGALLGDTRFFVSGGAEHQAPVGGGIFAAVVAD